MLAGTDVIYDTAAPVTKEPDQNEKRRGNSICVSKKAPSNNSPLIKCANPLCMVGLAFVRRS